MYEPLYPPDGAPLRAFRCKVADCGRVTRTERGMKAHCWFVHRIRAQLELFALEKNEAERNDLADKLVVLQEIINELDEKESTARPDGPIQQHTDGGTSGVEGTTRAGEETRGSDSLLPTLQGAGTPVTGAPPRQKGFLLRLLQGRR